MKLNLTGGSKSNPKKYDLEVELAETATVKDLQLKIVAKYPKLTPDRQRIKFGEKVLKSPNDTLKSYDLPDGANLTLKDLGPQIGWKTVFLIEYAGPIFIHPLFYYFSSVFYGQQVQHSSVQTAAFYMVIAHFLKREFETLFVHRFSNGTMPFFNVFKNSFHYHVLSGVLLAYFTYGPSLSLTSQASDRSGLSFYVPILLFIYSQLSNLSTHITLRNLRPPGSTVRKIPFGYGFDWVSCPNYLFESLVWVAFALLTRTYASLLFLVVSVGQMYLWSVKKHKAYKKEFSNYPKNRKIFIPYIH
ncbi:hypothetical protein CONCODRAFT_36866 [Conidiobolus coronatus NRRL 28638]|uniref:Ubiquitin-like domain-containing protein n=1 Tax=Conidiobolus coronatus (strain ATCC 28846 / CBS 209.66 / NRRL 28638) TaxID=796925 RepID=A0A137PBU5_CONC2|nr:hypothetical protein CONCODRAFT_36866 [Conidiobolus coronatus NRRL 28638]|eukprot:KXN72488.1 hypothetical protein CONCODRAFT_36866 [Conidiobolus coronatus NRRL 28638]